MKWTSRALCDPVWLLAVLLLAACSQASPTPTSEPRATPTVASAVSQSLDTATVPPDPEHLGPESTATAASPEPPASPSAREGGAGPLPELLVRIPLAPVDAHLYDLLLDSAAGRLYVTDTSGQLNVLDATTYRKVTKLPGSGSLTLDPDHNRLYVSPQHDEGELTVVDTENLMVVGTILPGGRVALDSKRERLYVGNPVSVMPEQHTHGVRVYDAETLIKVGEVSQPGIPVHNPLRDELYIVANTIHIVDPETLQVTGDLLPEITEQPLAWCNGCLATTNAHIYPDRNVLVVEVTILSAGKGSGTEPPPRFFDATTLTEITDPAQTPPVERGCRQQLMLAEAVNGQVFRGEHYSRYVFYNNLLVSDLDGSLQTWRDGLALGVTNPNTGQMYVPHGEDTLVLDLEGLAPAGALPPACIHTLDAGTGRIYALAGRDLVVLSERGGRLESPPTGPPGPLPEEQVLSIQPSPDYARDQTLFLTASSGTVYRSTDGGQTWAQLLGGLPAGEYLTLDLAISPDFAADQTLFAGGFRRDFWGEGVYRSTDGGDAWQPMWKDLSHLRVYDVVLSPDYAAGGTLLAYSNYQRITPWEGGASVYRSTDRGLTWTQVLTRSQAADLPPPEELLPAARALPAIQFRETGYGQSVERTIDGARTWEPLVITGQPDFTVQSIQKSPTFAVDYTVYVLTEFDLFRSTNGGQTWKRWRDERVARRDYANKLATAATSPALPDGRHQLFVGTHDGEFWTLDPWQLAWEPVHLAEQWPTVLEGEWVGEIVTVPNGDVWLGTWGNGLAQYADGTIRARHTITGGLPTQYIRAVAAAPDGTLWAGGDLPPGIASLDGDAWTRRPFPGEDRIGAVYDITVGPNGAVWAGAQAPGLLSWNGQDWELIPDPEGLTGWRINDIEVDGTGTVWSATARGLVFYGKEGWSGEGGQEATAVEFGPDDTAYLLLSDASVWRHTEGQWRGLPPLQEGHALSAEALHITADGAVWVGTQAGAFRYDGRSWRQFTAQDGLPANDVAGINQDAGGWLWFGTSNGAAHIDPEVLDLGPVAWPTLPAPTPPPGPTAVPRTQPTLAACAIPPAGSFARPYEEARTAGKLHCPIAEAMSTRAAYQPFEYGQMFWRGDERAIYVLDADGTWARYPDSWDDSQPPADPARTPPLGLLQPVRGFGKVWRGPLGGPGASLGWALAGEQGYKMQVQPFAGGQMFAGPWGEVYVLYADSTWVTRE